MSTVTMHNVVSVDGYIADVNDEVGPLFEWYGNGEVPLTEDGGLRLSRASFDYVRPMWDSIGSMVIGRTSSTSPTGGRGNRPPASTWSW